MENVKKSELKDAILLIICNTFHTDVTIDYIKSGDNMYSRIHFNRMDNVEFMTIINEMISDGHITDSDGMIGISNTGRDVFVNGGYMSL